MIKSSLIKNIKDYKFKFQQEQVDSELLNKNKNEENADALPKILANEILNKEKFNYQQLCKININSENKTFFESEMCQNTKLMLLNKNNVDMVNKQVLLVLDITVIFRNKKKL